MGLAKHLKELSANIQKTLVLAQADEPNLEALIAAMDKVSTQIEALAQWQPEELAEHKDLHAAMQSDLELLGHTLTDKSRNLQDAIGQASKRMQAHRKYAEADR